MHRRAAILILLAVALTIGARSLPAGTPMPARDASSAAGAYAAISAAPRDVVAHEWGTFTSIAGEQGQAVPWRPLEGPTDLPCFVERHRLCVKCMISALVRMETPVIYFYADEPATVDVTVGFRQGLVTEWYPSAKVTPATLATPMKDPAFSSVARWSNVSIQPGGPERYPSDARESHYYVARQTDAAPITVAGQHEKFLFYRGVGDFEPPVSATVNADGSIAVTARTDAALGTLILFENRGGDMAYRVRRIAGRAATLAPLDLDGEAMPPTAELEETLVADGLYPREARAMVNTWRDSWFEEGTRLLYLAPHAFVDARLPLSITPAPAAIVRTFVGRIELFTARTERAVSMAIERNDTAMLSRFGRFAGPIAERVLWRDPAMNDARFRTGMQPVYAAATESWSRATACR